MVNYKDLVVDLLSKEIESVDSSLIEVPPNSKMGDYAFPCFTLAKEFKKSPVDIAKDLSEKFQPTKEILKIECNGPYLNFFLAKEMIAKDVLSKVFDEKREFGKGNSKEKIMIEYSSPNTNKPLHLGHVRNIILGKAVTKIAKFSGNDVIQACVVNDRGVHICKSMLMYMKHGKDSEPTKKSDHYVGDYYVMFNDESKKDESLNDEAQEMLRKWEDGDENVRAVWKKMSAWANDGFQETYDSLGIEFDKFYYESELYKHGKEIIVDAFDRGVFVKDEGAIVADMEKDKLGKKVLVRGDGTSLYMTQDVFLAKKKFEDFNLDRSVYVVASEQNLHFKQLFKVLDMIGFDYGQKSFHLNYGMVYLPEGKMKSREGTVVDADNLIEEMIGLAKKEISERYSDMEEEEIDKRAKIIGIGALRFFLLKTDPSRDMTYNPKESIAFEGETGPYVQYAYARISSILRKAEREVSKDVDFSLYSEMELDLVKKLAEYGSVVEESMKHYKPSTVCRYLVDLAQMFNEYYHKNPILIDDLELSNARLLLIEDVRTVIKSGLALLGIETLEQM